MSLEEKDREDVLKFTRMVADHQGWKLCDDADPEMYKMLVDGLHVNVNRYGYYNCPCRLASGEKAKDKDIICPCVYAKPDIDEYGHCYCGLYISEEYHASGKKPVPIPERRPESKEA